MTNPTATAAANPLAALMRRPYLILVLANLFWGGNMVAGKLAVGNIDPFVLMLVRWTGAVLLLLPFAIGPLRRAWPVIRRHWLLYLFYGGFGYASFNMLIYIAAYHTSGVNISMEQVSINILVMALNFAIFRIGVKPLQLFGAALTIVGVALIATHGDLGSILSLDINLGDGLVLLACLVWAIYSLALRYKPPTDWMSFMVVTCAGAAIGSLFYLMSLGGGVTTLPARLSEATSFGWLIAAYTIIFPSVLSQMFYVRGVELIGPNRASLFINLLPLFGTIGAVLVLGESLQPFHLIAAAAIIVGIMLAEWTVRRGQISVSEP